MWSHLFWTGQQQHGPAPDSQQRRPVPCDALLDSDGGFAEGQLKRDAYCLSLLKGLACV